MTEPGKWSHRNLMPDALKMADDLDFLSAKPFHQLGVHGARQVVDLMRPRDHTPVHSVENFSVTGRHGEIPLRLYRPNSDPDLPVIIYFHGGGWTLGTLDGVDECCRTLANESSCALVSVDYRRAPENKFPVPHDDCYDVLLWVRDHASDKGLDGSTIAVAGDSAGGNLAIGVCLRARDENGPQVRLQALAYPAFDLPSDYASFREYSDGPVLTAQDCIWFFDNYLDGPDDSHNPYAIPAAADTLAGLPPALVITAEVDPLRDSAEQYVARLASDGVAAELHRYPGVFHSFFTEVGTLTAADEAVSEMAQLIGKTLLR
ncbi:alpha/beta hydrolase [Rhodococcus sp. Q1]|uniref:alpha/beta hydrolase n=1 Tax=Rhodococcus TaxID=1827 RepID=UPI0013EC2325|nr:alpha/beta hydrolase [Rhodococcus sp. Q1]